MPGMVKAAVLNIKAKNKMYKSFMMAVYLKRILWGRI
jgi:hypothetical protein